MKETEIEEFIDKGYELRVFRRSATKEIKATVVLADAASGHSALGSNVEESLERLEVYLKRLRHSPTPESK